MYWKKKESQNRYKIKTGITVCMWLEIRSQNLRREEQFREKSSSYFLELHPHKFSLSLPKRFLYFLENEEKSKYRLNLGVICIGSSTNGVSGECGEDAAAPELSQPLAHRSYAHHPKWSSL